MLSRARCALFALLSCGSFAGCAGPLGGDYLWWPSFGNYPTAYIYHVPVHDVALEVQCEIYQFLDDEKEAAKDNKTPLLLAPDKGAQVVLILQTDLSGSVQYTGVDLSKLGFPSLAQLVAASSATSKVPSLQAKGTGKATVSAEVDFTVAQSRKYPPLADCSKQNVLKHQYLALWLNEWMTNYKTYEAWWVQDDPFACSTKVTLKSQFLLTIDVSAGVNAFMTPPLILPINGFNVDASPDFQHSIQISFTLLDKNKNKPPAYCAPQNITQPAVKL